MKRSAIWCAAGLCVAVTACNRPDSNEPPLEAEPTVLGDRDIAPPRPVIVEGCLTASGDRLVLTELKSDDSAGGSTAAATESYRLVGMEENLRPHVGKRVRVTGEAEPEQVVDVRQSTPPAPATGQPAGTTGSEPQVETTETTRIEISDLQVRSVSPSTESCTAAPGSR